MKFIFKLVFIDLGHSERDLIRVTTLKLSLTRVKSKLFSFVRILYLAYRFWSKDAWRINYDGSFLFMIKIRMDIFQGMYVYMYLQMYVVSNFLTRVVYFWRHKIRVIENIGNPLHFHCFQHSHYMSIDKVYS